MSQKKSGRGRPKGSGLDDSAHLDAIMGLMKRDPALKPTTAIKRLGISDPSAIRRLRDKLAVARDVPEAAPSRAAISPSGSTRPALTRPQAISTAGQAHAPFREPARAESSIGAKRATPTPFPAMGLTTAADAGTDWIAQIGGLGLQAMAASFEFQWALLGQALRLPPVAAALKQQLLFNELTMTLCVPNGELRRTLH